MGFQQNMERLSFKEMAFFHLHSTCEADIGEEPLHTPRKNGLVEKIPYRRIWEDIEGESQRYEN